MIDPRMMIGVAALVFGVGIWLMLPRGSSGGRSLGTVLVAVSLGLLAAPLPRFAGWVAESVFFLLAGITVLAAVFTVTFRSPVYSAIWFGLSLLGTAGLFLLQGAQFLGVATVVVYAGAILVTFLFVLMLANPEGYGSYDRLSWGPRLSAATGAVVVAVLTLAVVSVFQNPVPERRPQPLYSTVSLDDGVMAREHMANLGAQLFSTNLVAVEVAGTLLLVALVGTVAIVAQIRRPRHGGHSHG